MLAVISGCVIITVTIQRHHNNYSIDIRSLGVYNYTCYMPCVADSGKE